MFKFFCGCLLLLLRDAPRLAAADPFCPAYPSALRTEMEQSLSLDREAQAYSRSARGRTSAVDLGSLANSANPIDRFISAKMASDGVAPAPRTADTEFLRRIYLDLSGRIPTPEQAERFLNGADET